MDNKSLQAAVDRILDAGTPEQKKIIENCPQAKECIKNIFERMVNNIDASCNLAANPGK